jgi:hypothetical protein
MEVAVPNIEQRQLHRQVVLQRSGAEVFIHGMRAGQQLTKVLRTDGNGNRQADGRPHGVAPPHPVPEAESSIDAELGRHLHIAGQSAEMPSDVATALRQKPSLGRPGIGHGLQGGE